MMHGFGTCYNVTPFSPAWEHKVYIRIYYILSLLEDKITCGHAAQTSQISVHFYLLLVQHVEYDNKIPYVCCLPTAKGITGKKKKCSLLP